jgi:UDP-glucose 4-epimerase
VSVPGSVREPVRHHAANLTGTLVMLQACCDAGVETFVFSSSCAVYGDAAAGAVDEAAATDPKSPYAVQKLASESYCRVFSELRGLRTFCLRYFNVYGPRQSVDTQYGAVIPNFIRAALSGSAPVVYGDGEQSRDFVYVDDVADANLRCCRSRMQDAHAVLNIGSGRGTSINALARHVGTASGVTLSPRHVEARPGDVRHSCADARCAAGRLGWQARVPIEEGLARTVAYFRSGRRDG